MTLANGIPDFDGSQKVDPEAEQAGRPSKEKSGEKIAAAAARKQTTSEQPEAEADVPVDGRDLEGEAMIRELPLNPDLGKAPAGPKPT